MKTLERENQTNCNPFKNRGHIPNLNNISVIIFDTRENVVDQWITRETTKNMLQKLDIDSSHFKTTYGIPVVEYFIGVIEGTKALGDCPIMQKFITFLAQRDISARDIFILCMALRRSLISHLFSINCVTFDKIPDLLEEISDIFDANLSGVLQIFSDLTREKDKKLQEQLLINKQQKQIQTILNLQNSIVCLIKDNKIILANKKFLEMVGIKNLKELHLYYPNEWGFISNVDYENELFKSKSYILWFEKILSDITQPPIKVTIVNRKTKKNIIFILKASKIPNQQNQYIITMTDVTVYEKQMQELISQAYIDPITGIYNKLKFQTMQRELIKESQGHIVIIEINHFRKLQKDYDKELVNELLNKVAKFLEIEVEKNFFVSHIDDGIFTLLSKYGDHDDVATYIAKIETNIKNLQFYISQEITYSFGIIRIRQNDTNDTVNERIYQLIELLTFSKSPSIKYDDELFEKQESLVKENNQIISNIQEKTGPKTIIKVTVPYKEIPVKWELQFSHIKNDIAVFSIINKTSLLFKAPKVYFRLSKYQKAIECNLNAIDIHKREVNLHNFHFIEDSILDRKVLCVKPQKDFTVLLYNESYSQIGILHGISQHTLSIIVENIQELHIGTQATIDMILTYDNKSIKFNIEVNIQTFRHIKNGYLLTMVPLLDQDNENSLKSYVAWRQMQIIKELKNLIGRV